MRPRADSGRGRQLGKRQRRHGRAGLPRRARDARRGGRGARPRARAPSRSPRPARSAFRLRSTPSGAACRGGGEPVATRRRGLRAGDHDHRPRPEALHGAQRGVTVSAQAKGAGMIQPGFATMLCFVQTDAQIPDPEAALRAAVADSFERITVDGQMSTNDTVLLQATGASGQPLPEGLLDAVLLQLALEVVADGEGATRVGRIEVDGAASTRGGRARGARDRQLAARQDGALRPRSQLGPDRPGRGDGARRRGARGARPRRDRGRASWARTARRPRSRCGSAAATAAPHVYFSDLSHDYIELNSEYTT